MVSNTAAGQVESQPCIPGHIVMAAGNHCSLKSEALSSTNNGLVSRDNDLTKFAILIGLEKGGPVIGKGGWFCIDNYQ